MELNDFPTPSEGKAAWTLGHADATASAPRSATYDQPRRALSFRDGCLAAAYHRGYNHGTQEALQVTYGDAPTIQTTR